MPQNNLLTSKVDRRMLNVGDSPALNLDKLFEQLLYISAFDYFTNKNRLKQISCFFFIRLPVT
jgi:hypothetical protein